MGMRRFRNMVVLALLCGVSGTSASATTTEVHLLLSADTARPGDTVMAGISLQMQPGWHSYWRNPGDSGLATKVKWNLPSSITAGEIQWPVPEKLSTPPLITYDYNGQAILLVLLKIAADAPAGPMDIEAKVSWQECAEQCILGNTTVQSRLTVGNESKPSADAALIEAAKAKPPTINPKLNFSAHWEKDADSRPLVIEWEAPDKPAEVDFYPYGGPKYEVAGETERLADKDGKVQIRKMVTKTGPDWPTHIDGLLISKATKESPPVAYEVSLTPGAQGVESVGAAMPVAANQSLLVEIIFAFIGGLILNIMPCVLPVIALKVLGFVNQAKEEPGRVRTLGLIYGFGVLVSFLVLAGIAIAVQHAGGLAGWSTAFQNPQFRVIITILITLVALNLFGVFEVTVGGRTMGTAAELTAKQGVVGAFFNGVLATLLATPCTAPILATAIGFAFTQPPGIIVLMFIAVGLGLAAPFVLLCWWPAWLKFLPKPGLWMQRFKVAIGFPVLATAVWLFWFTATRMGKTGVLWFGLFLVVLALAAWIWGEFVQRGTRRVGVAMIISLLFVGSAYGFILEKQLHWRTPNFVEKDAIDWQPWSPEAVDKARSEGHPVLVDFTADSCVNCKANLITSIDIKSTRDKLREIKAVTLEGDFTDADPGIARELKRFGRPGVPLVLVYPADKSLQPTVLPPLLTPGIVQKALNDAAPSFRSVAAASNR